MSTVPDGPARRLLADLDAALEPVPSPLDAKYAAIWAEALGVDPPRPQPDDHSLADYRQQVREAVDAAPPRPAPEPESGRPGPPLT